MPSTYTYITGTTFTDSLSSTITFSNISQRFDDLELRYVSRDLTDTPLAEMPMAFNGESISGTLMSSTYMRGDTTSNTSGRYSSNGYVRFIITGPGSYTANLCASGSVYIADYKSSGTRAIYCYGVPTNDAGTAGFLNSSSVMYRGTAPITSIYLQTSNKFVAGTSFSLYGIVRG